MKNRVYNKTLGKIFRTLGFLLVLASSVYIATQLILENDTLPLIDNLLPFANQINDIISGFAILGEYAGLALVVGLIMIVWAIRRGLVLRVLVTALLLFVYVEGAVAGTTPLAPIVLGVPSWFLAFTGLIETYIVMLTDISEYIIPGISLGAPIMLWAVFANKKPSRLSTFVYRISTTLLFLAILLNLVKVFVPSLDGVAIVATINVALYILSYLLFVVGGVFGVLGFARK
jgi:hypothetical protein